MSARIIVHPRCADGPASAALAAHLQEKGFDIQNSVVVGPKNKHGNYDLVRHISAAIDRTMLFERMDGVRFCWHPTYGYRADAIPPEAPEAA